VKRESAEIDLRILDGGDLLIPAEVLNRLNVSRGNKVHIKVSTSVLSGQLKQRNVTEEEIEHIAALQFEPKENVIKCLATESRFSENKGFKRRAQGLRGKT
jgi:antitoxin component of MazEF toxin-antitoxin module